MERKESPSQLQKQSKRAKKTMKGLQTDQPLEIQGRLELTKQIARKQVSEDRDVQVEAGELVHKQKRHFKNTSCDSKSHDRRDIPKTLISALLEELNDDIIGEPTGFDTGDCSTVDPPPTSLPSDKVYVECKNGFATTPRRKMFHPLHYTEGDIINVENSKSVGTPLELAILVQKWCHPFYTLCHGLLGGMALLHIILVYYAGDSNFVYMYTQYARIYQTLFHVLCIFCFISILDRCDAKHMHVPYLADLFRYHITTILVLAVYMSTLVLTFVTTKWDDWLILSPYSTSVKNVSDTADALKVWNNLNLFRNIGAISGWVLTAFFPNEDMLYVYLCNMMKYQTVTAHVVSARY